MCSPAGKSWKVGHHQHHSQPGDFLLLLPRLLLFLRLLRWLRFDYSAITFSISLSHPAVSLPWACCTPSPPEVRTDIHSPQDMHGAIYMLNLRYIYVEEGEGANKCSRDSSCLEIREITHPKLNVELQWWRMQLSQAGECNNKRCTLAGHKEFKRRACLPEPATYACTRHKQSPI